MNPLAKARPIGGANSERLDLAKGRCRTLRQVFYSVEPGATDSQRIFKSFAATLQHSRAVEHETVRISCWIEDRRSYAERP